MNKISLFYCYTADILKKTRLHSPPPAFIHIYKSHFKYMYIHFYVTTKPKLISPYSSCSIETLQAIEI